MFLGEHQKRLAFRFGRQSALRSTNATVEQLQQQLDAERAQRAFDAVEFEKQIALLLRDVARAEYELAKAKAALALVLAPSPSEMEH